ncbi:MAG TPA: hypothetical protein VFE47_10205 [Tepidisphaeraceae bacterium]|nr:hypothetical protein [Tepidisphaeraceae bacterium]
MGDIIVFIVGAALVGGAVWAFWVFWPSFVDRTAECNASSGRNEGACEECGYDLQGGHDRCPECGKSTLEQDAIGFDPEAFDMRALTSDWPSENVEPTAPSASETVCVLQESTDREIARLLSAHLIARGIWSDMGKEIARNVGNGLTVALGTWRVIVIENDRGRAQDAIDRFRKKNTVRGKGQKNDGE